MRKPSLPIRARKTVESLEHDPIDRNFDGLDVDIIPDIGKGPTLPLSTEESVIRDDFAYHDELWHAEKNEESCMSHIEMDEQMHEAFDKELPPAGIMLPQRAVDNLWTRPVLIFNGRPSMETTPKFDPSIDLTDAPSWSDLVSFALNPNSLRYLEEEVNQPSFESGSAKPLSIKPSDAGHGHETGQGDAEPTPILENIPSSIILGKDSVNANASSKISEESCSIYPQQRSFTKPQKKHVRFLPVTVSERRLKQVKETLKKKENRVDQSVAAGQGGSEPAVDSSRPPTKVHRQFIKLSSKDPVDDILRRSARVKAKRFPHKKPLTVKNDVLYARPIGQS